MKTKNNLHGLVWSVFVVILAFFCITLFNVQPRTTAHADGESSQIVTLFTPTATGENYTSNFNADWNETTVVEDYTDSPTGKVLHQTINYTQGTTVIHPSLTLKIPYSGEATNYAGYVIWLEYSGNVYSNDSYWGLFNFNFGNDSNTISYNQPITFVDANGKINETKSGGWMYHRNNNTEIENSGYAFAYSYAFKGYMIIPDSSLSGTAHAPAADRELRFAHHYLKTLENVDIKIGMVGYYTDYNALLAELGRCTYSFVDGDTTVETATVKPGTEVVAPEYSNSYVKNGKIYTFMGWRGYTDGMTVSEDTTFTAVYKVTDFHMVKGASIRTNEGTSGIRYTAEFDEDLYNEISLDENREFGMLITKLDYYNQAMASNAGDLIAGLNELGNNKYVLITESSANPVKVYRNTTETDVTYRINGALTNIQYSHADWTWIGVGVIVETDGDNVSYTYAVHSVEESARTTSYVASAALNNPAENFTSAEKATLKNYVYKSAAKSAGVSETNFNAQEDKSSYLDDYTLTISGGFDVQYKFNENVAGEEAYMTIGEKATVLASIVNDNGEALDVAYSVNVTDSSVLSVNGGEVTALKNGYATVTIACDLFGYSKQLTVYTGSTDAGNLNINSNAQNESSGYNFTVNGEIGGQNYYGYTYRRRTDGAGATYWVSSYTKQISAYYIDYLISQGYKYVRIPFYIDTTHTQSIFQDGLSYAKMDSATARTSIGAPVAGSARLKDYTVAVDEWVYYDMDIQLYRANMTGVDTVIDQYGMKTASSSAYTYPTLIFPSIKDSFVYFGAQTFIKSSTLTVNESNDVPSFCEEINLADFYETNGVAATYTVDGVAMNTMTAVYKEHNVTISANIYTANIGNGTYTIGNSAAWTIHGFTAAESVQKVMTVQNGLDVSATTLVDVNGITTDVSIGAYTGADELTNAGFDVTQTYVKRYGDGTEVVSDTVANSERGIFYVDVVATKGAQSISYEVTLDLYNSSEPVEYESFGHADSKYAVKIYYYAYGALTNKSYEKLVNEYTVDSGNGFKMSVDDDYVSLEKYGQDATLDKANSAAATVYGSDPTGTIYYLAIDQSKISDVGPIVHEVGNSTTAINIYVTPRHTKEYYEECAKNNTGVLRYAFAAGWSKGQSKRYSLQNIENGVATITYKDMWSANWQSWAYDNQSVTLTKIVDNYEAFCSNNFPIYISEDPHGRTETDLNNGVMKLGSLIF